MIFAPDKAQLEPDGQGGDQVAHDDDAQHKNAQEKDKSVHAGEAQEVVSPGEPAVVVDGLGLHDQVNKGQDRSYTQGLEKGHGESSSHDTGELPFLPAVEELVKFGDEGEIGEYGAVPPLRCDSQAGAGENAGSVAIGS